MRTLDAARLLALAFRDFWAETVARPYETVATVVMTVFWSAWAVVGVRFFFHFGPYLGGWSEPAALAVLGAFLIVNGFRQAFVQPALRGLSGWMKDGTVEARLARPASASVLLYVSFMQPTALAELATGAGLVGYGIARSEAGGPPEMHALEFLWLYVVSCVFVHSLGLVCRSVVFVVGDHRAVDGLFSSALEGGRYPSAFYASLSGVVTTALFGTVLLTNEPARAALGTLPAAGCLEYTAGVLALYVASRVAWERVLTARASSG